MNDHTGWVAGSLGGKGVILATTDGGRTWQRQYTGNAGIIDLQFISPAIGWAEESAGDAGILLHTTDGGKTWVPLSHIGRPIPLVFITSRYFITATLGRAVFEPEYKGALMETRDGGKTWTAVPTSTKLRSVCFSDTDHGWGVTGDQVVRTGDGGRTWGTGFAAPTDLVGGPTGSGVHPYDVLCVGQNAAWALFLGGATAFQQGYVLYRTTDAGAHWAPALTNDYRQLKTTQGGDAEPGPISVVDSDIAFLVGVCEPCANDPAVIQGTEDGGATWGSSNSLPLEQAASISFLDAHHGWAVGRATPDLGLKAVILATSDGGKTWTQQYP